MLSEIALKTLLQKSKFKVTKSLAAKSSKDGNGYVDFKFDEIFVVRQGTDMEMALDVVRMFKCHLVFAHLRLIVLQVQRTLIAVLAYPARWTGACTCTCDEVTLFVASTATSFTTPVTIETLVTAMVAVVAVVTRLAITVARLSPKSSPSSISGSVGIAGGWGFNP